MVITDRNGHVMPVRNLADLDKAIAELKEKKELQEDEIHEAFEDLKEGLRPINLLKSAVHKITDTNTPLELGLKIAGTVGTALIAKKIFSSHKDDDKVVEKVVVKDDKSYLSKFAQGMVTNFLVSHIPTIAAYSSAIFHNVVGNTKEDDAS